MHCHKKVFLIKETKSLSTEKQKAAGENRDLFIFYWFLSIPRAIFAFILAVFVQWPMNKPVI
jgi:hypothetical protein